MHEVVVSLFSHDQGSGGRYHAPKKTEKKRKEKKKNENKRPLLRISPAPQKRRSAAAHKT